MERLTIKNSDGTYSQPTHTTFEKMFYRLAEFEDFLEEMGFDNLKTFKKAIKFKLNYLAKAYVIQFEDGSYWKGQGGKITKNLRSASFLRECDIKNKENLAHTMRMVKEYYNLHTFNILKVNISVVGAVGGIVDGEGGA